MPESNHGEVVAALRFAVGGGINQSDYLHSGSFDPGHGLCHVCAIKKRVHQKRNQSHEPIGRSGKRLGW